MAFAQGVKLRASPRSPLWRALATFLLSALCMQLAWNMARGTLLERWVVDDATVHASAALINRFTPEERALVRGTSIAGRHGAINVRNGCEGTEALFLLVAAFIAYPLPVRLRLAGIAAGILLVFVLNQARLLALYYSVRRDPALFDTLHGLVTPLLLIVSVVSFFVGVLEWDRRRREPGYGG